jgi:hypothetical protein
MARFGSSPGRRNEKFWAFMTCLGCFLAMIRLFMADDVFRVGEMRGHMMVMYGVFT